MTELSSMEGNEAWQEELLTLALNRAIEHVKSTTTEKDYSLVPEKVNSELTKEFNRVLRVIEKSIQGIPLEVIKSKLPRGQ